MATNCFAANLGTNWTFLAFVSFLLSRRILAMSCSLLYASSFLDNSAVSRLMMSRSRRPRALHVAGCEMFVSHMSETPAVTSPALLTACASIAYIHRQEPKIAVSVVETCCRIIGCSCQYMPPATSPQPQCRSQYLPISCNLHVVSWPPQNRLSLAYQGGTLTAVVPNVRECF